MRGKNTQKTSTLKGYSSMGKAVIRNTFGMEKYGISTIIYICEDKSEYYLHDKRLQYVQGQAN